MTAAATNAPPLPVAYRPLFTAQDPKTVVVVPAEGPPTPAFGCRAGNRWEPVTVEVQSDNNPYLPLPPRQGKRSGQRLHGAHMLGFCRTLQDVTGLFATATDDALDAVAAALAQPMSQAFGTDCTVAYQRPGWNTLVVTVLDDGARPRLRRRRPAAQVWI